jgi:UDP-N-acetyl-D-mannosaminuronic acid transferase (WecB/TagA/CpsF family)
MALPAVGDGYQVGDGNTGEDLLVGRTGQPVQFGGSAAAELGFFGATPAAQPAATNQAAIASTAAVSVSATQWGFSTSTQATAVITLLTEVRAALVTLGLIKGSN